MLNRAGQHTCQQQSPVPEYFSLSFFLLNIILTNSLSNLTPYLMCQCQVLGGLVRGANLCRQIP